MFDVFLVLKNLKSAILHCRLQMPINAGEVNYEQALQSIRDGHGPKLRVLNSQLSPLQAEEKLKKMIKENLRNITLVRSFFQVHNFQSEKQEIICNS